MALHTDLIGKVRALYYETKQQNISTGADFKEIGPPAWTFPENNGAASNSIGEMQKVFLFGAWYPVVARGDGAPDWHTDPIEKARWPDNVSTDRIDTRGANRPGDVKLVWEPSRFYQLFDLCSQGAVGAEVAATHVTSWIDQNAWMIGVHWDNALEAALRTISWISADSRLSRLGFSAWTKVRNRVISALWWHGKFIDAHLSLDGYNHLIGDAAGLAVLGASYPELPGAKRWRDRGFKILLNEIDRQILEDGGYVEQAPAYARFVADLYILVGHVAGGYRTQQGAQFWQAAVRLLHTLMLQATPRGELPGYGDDDGAMVLWTGPSRHRLGLSLALAAAISGRSDFKYVSALSDCTDRAREIITTVLGPERLAAFDELHAGPPSETSVCLADSGIAIFRSDWGIESDWLLFKCGPMGVAHGAHAHPDNLQILWQKKGWPSLKDPGTPTYNGDQTLRNGSTSTYTHNTVCVDGCSQAVRQSRFVWRELTHGEQLHAEQEANRWKANGSITYDVEGQRVKHERVVEVEGQRVAVIDTVQCTGGHKLALGFLFEGSLRWDALNSQIFAPGRVTIDVAYSGWRTVLTEDTYTCPIYNVKDTATRLVFSADMNEVFEGTIVFSRDD